MCLAIPGKILSIDGEEMDRTGTVDFEGMRREVNLAFVPEANIGDYVLIHVGFAIGTIDEEEAQSVFDTLREMGEVDELAGGPS